MIRTRDPIPQPIREAITLSDRVQQAQQLVEWITCYSSMVVRDKADVMMELYLMLKCLGFASITVCESPNQQAGKMNIDVALQLSAGSNHYVFIPATFQLQP